MLLRRLTLEILECRRVLSSVGWDGPGLGAAELSYFIGDAPSSLTHSEFKNAIETALDAWSDVVDIEFTETNVSRQADSLDFSARSLDGAGGTLAQAYFPDDVNRSSIAGDVQFDLSEAWEVGNSQGRHAFDLVVVAVHEIGHALGLEHIHQSGSILQPTISPSQTFVGLSAHDIEAIQNLYASVDVTPVDELPVANSPADMTPSGNGTPIIDITIHIGTPTTNTTLIPNLFDGPFAWNFPIDGFQIGGFQWRGFGFFEPHILIGHNDDRPADVNQDRLTTAIDALIVINALNDGSSQHHYLTDTNNDGVVTAADALIVINQLHDTSTINGFSRDSQGHDAEHDEFEDHPDTLAADLDDIALSDDDSDHDEEDHEFGENESQADHDSFDEQHRFIAGLLADDFFARLDGHDNHRPVAGGMPEYLWHRLSDEGLINGVDKLVPIESFVRTWQLTALSR